VPILLVVFWTKTKKPTLKYLATWGRRATQIDSKNSLFCQLFFYYNGNLLAIVDAFNNLHCRNKLNTQNRTPKIQI